MMMNRRLRIFDAGELEQVEEEDQGFALERLNRKKASSWNPLP